MRRLLAISTALLVLAAACGDDSPFGGGTTEVSTSSGGATSTMAAPTTTVAPTTTAAPATTTTVTTTAGPATTAAATTTAAPATTTTLSPGPTAADALRDAGFFGAVEDLDRLISDTAAWFNETWDSGAGTVDPDVRDAILALDAGGVARRIPPGLPPEVERAALAVYADLDSRIAALDGAVRYPGDTEMARICLEYGGDSFQRYTPDWITLLDTAALSPAPPAPPPDSPEAGVLAVRIETIRSMNWGCDSCGGVAYDAPIEVDWEGRTVLGVGFDAEFTGGRWEILIYAC